MAKQTEIAYEGKEWKSYQTGGTLVRAADLNNIENGIVETCAGVDELRTKRLPTYVVAQDGDTATQDVYSEDILGPCLILDLATRTTYYETGGEEGGHRKALVSGDEIDDIRDSVSQVESGTVSTEGIYSGNTADVEVSFVRQFSSEPTVVAGLVSASTAAGMGSVSVAVVEVTTTGCTLRFCNDDSSSRAPSASWVAVGA